MALSAGDFVRELQGNKVLLVTDAFLVRSGMLDGIIASLTEASAAPPVLFSDVPADSDIDCVNAGAELARLHDCDAIVCVGGGSVIDTAKVINLCLTYGGDLMEYQGLNLIDRSLFPLVAIPTTAGTGSEVTFVAMVKDHAQKRKLMFGSPYLAPDMAILDPELLLSLPPHLTAATGMDAITHGIESFVATNTNSSFTNALCLESLSLLFKWLPVAYRDGRDIEARSATLIASCMAGVAFNNSGVGVVHGLAHSVGAMFGTHHGMTNAIFLPHGMRFNMDIAAERFAAITAFIEPDFAGTTEDKCQRLISRVESLMHEMQMPANLAAIKIPKLNGELAQELALMAAADPAIIFNPKEVSLEELRDLLDKAY